MYTTYHLSSAQELTTDIMDSFKATFKGKPIIIIVEEELDTTAYLMSSAANRAMLRQSIAQAQNGEFVKLENHEWTQGDIQSTGRVG